MVKELKLTKLLLSKREIDALKLWEAEENIAINSRVRITSYLWNTYEDIHTVSS